MDVDFSGHFVEGDEAAYKILGEQVPLSGTAVEVGTLKGKSARVLCELFKDDDRKLICVDTWAGSPNEPDTMKLYADQDIYGIFLNNIKESGYNHIVTPLRKDSLVAAATFRENETKFDLIFLDSTHDRDFVMKEIRAWLPCLKHGGNIAGHDYRPGPVGFAIDLSFSKQNVQTYKGGSVWSVNWGDIAKGLLDESYTD